MESPIGIRLRRIRRAQDVTQQQLAHKAGLNVITVSRLENGTAKAVYADTVSALAKALSVSSDYLLGVTDDPRSYADLTWDLTQGRALVAVSRGE